MSWDNKLTVIKGDIGEALVNSWLEDKGFVVYKPITNCAHAFDRLAIKNKNFVVIAEVKTKAHRNYFPDTGIDLRHYQSYKYVSKKHNMPVWLFFVDEMKKEIYGNKLDVLDTPLEVQHKAKCIQYPLIDKANKIIYFPLQAMVTIAALADADVASLKNSSTRKYEYLPEVQ